MAEDGSVLDGVVHHLLLPGTVAHKSSCLFCLLLGPLLFPYGFAVFVHSLDFGHIHALCGCNVRQHRVLGYEVSHHNEATTTHIKRTEQGFFHPIGQIVNTLLVAAKLIIIQVIDNDVVRSCLLVPQATG